MYAVKRKEELPAFKKFKRLFQIYIANGMKNTASIRAHHRKNSSNIRNIKLSFKLELKGWIRVH